MAGRCTDRNRTNHIPRASHPGNAGGRARSLRYAIQQANDAGESGLYEPIYFNHPGLDTDDDPSSQYDPTGKDFSESPTTVVLPFGSLVVNQATSIIGPRDAE